MVSSLSKCRPYPLQLPNILCLWTFSSELMPDHLEDAPCKEAAWTRYIHSYHFPFHAQHMDETVQSYTIKDDMVTLELAPTAWYGSQHYQNKGCEVPDIAPGIPFVAIQPSFYGFAQYGEPMPVVLDEDIDITKPLIPDSLSLELQHENVCACWYDGKSFYFYRDESYEQAKLTEAAVDIINCLMLRNKKWYYYDVKQICKVIQSSLDHIYRKDKDTERLDSDVGTYAILMVRIIEFLLEKLPQLKDSIFMADQLLFEMNKHVISRYCTDVVISMSQLIHSCWKKDAVVMCKVFKHFNVTHPSVIHLLCKETGIHMS